MLLAQWFLIFFMPLLAAPSKIKVVTSFTVLKDMVQQIGKEHVEVKSIVGANGDPHTYEPSARDVCSLDHADVVFTNGWHLDGWVQKLTQACLNAGPIVCATEGITPRIITTDHCAKDPHAWHNPLNGIKYVENITRELCRLRPQLKDVFQKNAAEYIKRLRDAYDQIKAWIDESPADKRVIVTAHEGFGYFGDAFEILFFAPLGMSTEEEVGPRSMVSIIQLIRKTKLNTLFAESISDDRILRQITDDTNANLGPNLYSDSLSEEGGPADSYEKMLLHNAWHIAKSLKESFACG